MKLRAILFSLLVFCSPGCADDVASIAPADAAKLVAAGTAVLVDVREPAEWAETGVAAPAVLLPKSEFDEGLIGDWKGFLAQVGDRQIILYCRSGRRSGIVAAALAGQGYRTANGGGFKDWQAAGLPVRKIMQPAGDVNSR
jgi:rhodanese-related sulfurtransferase